MFVFILGETMNGVAAPLTPVHAPAHVPAHAPAHVPVHVPANIPIHPPAHVPAHPPAHAPMDLVAMETEAKAKARKQVSNLLQVRAVR